jgi:nitroreductase
LLGAAALGLDACPMEGFDADVLAGELGLGPKAGGRWRSSPSIPERGRLERRAAQIRLPAATLFTDL